MVYLPVAIVNYTANDSEYRHFVSLTNGTISGDLPLNQKRVRRECAEAGRHQQAWDALRWCISGVWLAGLAFVASNLMIHDTEVLTTHWKAILVGLVLSIVCYVKSGHPWKEFVWNRRAHLTRLVANPPANLEKAMLDGADASRIKAIMSQAAAGNTLEELEYETAWPIVDHAGRVLLKSVAPFAGLRLPRAISIMIRMGIAILVFIGVFMEKVNEPIKHTSSESDLSFLKSSSTSPGNAASTSKFPSKNATSKPEVTDPRLPKAKAELIELQAKIDAKRAKWKAASDIVNKLTYNRHVTLPKSSPDYPKLEEASKVMQEVENEAPPLNARKADLEALIRQLEPRSGESRGQ